MPLFKHVMIVIVLLPAYVQAAPTASDCDFNNNGQVDFADFIAFSQGYGTNQTQFDLNGDGAINFQDFIIFVQFYGQTITDVPVGIEVGLKAPDFTLETLTGKRFNLYEQHGNPVFLNFWTTWCPPCVAEMPDIQKLQDTMADSILIVGVDVQEPRSTVQSFVASYGYTYTFVLDRAGTVFVPYGVSFVPTSYFLDAKGVIVRKFVGLQNYKTFLEATRQAINN